MALSPVNGLRPVAISNKTMPTEKMSLRGSAARDPKLAPGTCKVPCPR